MGLPCPRCARPTRTDSRFCDGCGLALQPASGAEPALAPGSGREQELALVERRLDAALGGSGGTVALCGEPGIGKSHTAKEIARRGAAKGMQVYWGRCNEEPGAPPYWPWQQVLRAWLAAQDVEPLRRVLGRDAAALADLLPELAQRLPELAPLPAIPDAQQARFRLFEAIASFCKRAAEDAPLLLVLDNLHWADASSLRLLEFIAPDLASCRMLVVVTYRDMELSRQH